jgi:acetyltransferase-like isoleucine patch superfamily enzyme
MRRLPDTGGRAIIIEDNVFIGYATSILKGVTIGQNSVIGANSVVTSNIPANCIAAGNPCKVIKTL